MLTDPDQIKFFRLLTLRKGLQLEIRGMRVSRGRSCYSIIKSECGLTGSRATVLVKFNEMLSKCAD